MGGDNRNSAYNGTIRHESVTFVPHFEIMKWDFTNHILEECRPS